MSRIERQMIAEARAAREAQHQRQEAADIGADVPSAPNDEQTHDDSPGAAWLRFIRQMTTTTTELSPEIIWHVPPLFREDKDE